jgi:hypothetical protein
MRAARSSTVRVSGRLDGKQPQVPLWTAAQATEQKPARSPPRWPTPTKVDGSLDLIYLAQEPLKKATAGGGY